MSAAARPFAFALLVALTAAAAPGGALAQPSSNAAKSVPNALQGFSENRGQPVQIEASRLEVRDKDKVATFSGNVKVAQGDTVMRCKSLVVYYEGGQGVTGAMKTSTPGPGGSSQISRLEALGGVTVLQKDQTASGNTGLFDMKTNTVTLIGNVLVSQGGNVLRGERLVVDLTTGVSKVEAGRSNGPVRMLIQQGTDGALKMTPAPAGGQKSSN